MNSKRLVDHALGIALHHHANQWRRGALLPYISHPLAVARRLALWGLGDDPIVIAAAITHDVLEDSYDVDLARATIAAHLGEGVLALVEELTCPAGTDKGEYLASFARKSVQALLIKFADRLTNVEDLLDGERQLAYHKAAEILYLTAYDREAEISATFGDQLYPTMLRDLKNVTGLVYKTNS